MTAAVRYVCSRCGEIADAPGACRRDGEILDDADDDLLGTEVGGYRIASSIGRGGMGGVYRAVQVASDAEVAIKVLAAELIDERESSERFVNEARAANRTRHEGLVKVLFIGLLPDGRPYLIMEHLTGAPLSTLIGAQLPLGTLLRRLAEAMRAIAAMHDAGVIHRDLKPSNLFVTTAGFIKVLDFGIAKLADDRSGLTRTGHTIGTPGYMSPEQANADVLDARSDIYSLGVVLYETVVGQRPFEGRVVEALEARELPPPLSPPALNAIVQRAMAHDRSDRYANVNELADAIEAVAAGLSGDGPLIDAPLAVPVTEVPPTVVEKAQRRIGRYVVEGTAGRGGEGVVLIGRDPKVQRKVALKLLDAGDRRDRLLSEAQAMARISHPNVVTLYELGEDGDQLFLAMEFLEATDLERWLVEERSWREIVAMFVAAGRGLAAAHAEGVVHRDFKPANVLLGKDGRPRVGDFGIAELTAATGDASGTASYMAPEQIEAGTVDPRSDQFSFCAALWHALHGELPYAGNTAVAIAIAARRGELRAPKRDVPARITEALRRGLASEPDKRFPDITALLAALEHQPRRRWPYAVVGAGAIGVIAVIATRESAPPVVDEPVLKPSQIAAMEDPMDRLRAIDKLPLLARFDPEVLWVAREAVANGFTRRVMLDADPIASAASFSRDGTLVVPTATATLAIARDGSVRKLPASLKPPRRVFLDDNELRVLLDDSIVATPLDRIAWKARARCDYSRMAGKQAEANAELTILACIGWPSRVIVDGKPGPILIDSFDAIAFAGRRFAIRRPDWIELYEASSATPIARLEATATHVAAARDIVAYVADGKAVLWDPATGQTAPGRPAKRVDVIGGAEPIAIATIHDNSSVMYAVRTPVLGVVDVDALAVPAIVAGTRIVEQAKSEITVRDHAMGRAWRARGSFETVIADANARYVALFDKRELRLWSVEGPPATTIRGLVARTAEDSVILSSAGWRSPLRAFSPDGVLQHRIDTPARILDSVNGLVVEREGKTARWKPAVKQLDDLADRVLDRTLLVGTEVLALVDGKVTRVRDGAEVCAGAPLTSTRDGAVVLVMSNSKLFACRPATKATVAMKLSFELASATNMGRARWLFHNNGRLAAGLFDNKLSLFSTETGEQLEIPKRGFEPTVQEVAFAPTSERMMIVAEEGMFLSDGEQLVQPGLAIPYRNPQFVDDDHVIVLKMGRIEMIDLISHDDYELASLSTPHDKSSVGVVAGHAVGVSRHLTTGFAISISTAMPTIAELESWLARIR